MICNKCHAGRIFLDRVFSDNTSFETSCLHCGDRRFISKKTEFGQWLERKEQRMASLVNGM